MKIGYYIQHFPYVNHFNDKEYIKQYRLGGSEIVAYYLATNIAKKGHEVHIFTTSINRQDSLEKYGNINIHRYGKSFKVGEYNISYGLFHKPLKQQLDLDIIHAHLSVKIDGLAALLHAKKKKIPFIVTHHADTNVYSGFIHKTRVVYFFSNYIIKKCFSLANIIISPSECYIDESRFLGRYRDKIVVIPNGINIEDFNVLQSKERCREDLLLPINENMILSVGALSLYKGHDILVKAMSKIVKEMPQTKLVFVGSGKMRNGLEKEAKKLGVDKHIKFAGFVEEKLKSLYYGATDIFVLPSIMNTESFGIVNLEAMACGVPVVASKIGGVPDVVRHGENGLLVPPKDSEALADAIIYLLENEDARVKMGKNGREKVEDYSWEKIAEETEKVYKKVMNESHAYR